MVRNNYPETIIEVLDDDIQYPPAVIKTVKRFAIVNPWEGSSNTRKMKFQLFNRYLARACHIIKPTLVFDHLDGSSSGASYYLPQDHQIVINGKLSVVTFLHEFGHAMGYGEREACRWSINLFRKCFPRQYSRLIHIGHTLIRPESLAQNTWRKNNG